MNTRLFTIGFGETTASHFFSLLKNSGVTRVIDVRLNNTSQLSGFTKRDDLRFFLKAVGDIDYVHMPQLAPTQPMLDALKKQKGSWQVYQEAFEQLMKARAIEKLITRELADLGCLLCSEKRPEQCHRRLVAEYLCSHWGKLEIFHLA